MNSAETNKSHRLAEALSRSAARPPRDLTGAIMDRIREEPARARRRESRLLAVALVSFTVLLVVALYFVLRDFAGGYFETAAARIKPVSVTTDHNIILWSGYMGAISLLLLFADHFLRRRYAARHREQ